jgi:hypothetical protein
VKPFTRRTAERAERGEQIMSRKKPAMIGFEIPDQDKKRLTDLAARNGRSVSAEMRIALARHLGKTSKKGGGK